MTQLTGGKSVTRESLVRVRGRSIVVTVNTHFVVLREKGRRSSYEVPIEACYWLGAKAEARRKAEERKAARRKTNANK